MDARRKFFGDLCIHFVMVASEIGTLLALLIAAHKNAGGTSCKVLISSAKRGSSMGSCAASPWFDLFLGDIPETMLSALTAQRMASVFLRLLEQLKDNIGHFSLQTHRAFF